MGRYPLKSMGDRMQAHGAWTCPDCGAPLEPRPAQERKAGYGPWDRARCCTRCPFWGVGRADWSVPDPRSYAPDRPPVGAQEGQHG